MSQRVIVTVDYDEAAGPLKSELVDIWQDTTRNQEWVTNVEARIVERHRLDVNLSVSGDGAMDYDRAMRVIGALGWDASTLEPSDTGDPNEWSIEVPESVAEFIKERHADDGDSPDWHIQCADGTLFVFSGALVTIL